MPLSINQVLRAPTEEQALRTIVGLLEDMGFVASSWHEGSIQRSILQMVARAYSGVGTTVASFASNAIVRPQGLWLDIVGVYRFGIPRLEAVRTRRSVILSNAASAPAHSITTGSYLSTPDGVRFRIEDGPHALSPGASIEVDVTAEIAGSAGNAPHTTLLAVQTPAYSGVTAAFTTDPLEVIGADVESDDRYWHRCQLRWAELTYSVGVYAYELWALTAAPSLRRARGVPMYPTPYAVRVALDPGEPSEVSAVEAYIADRIPPNDVVTVSAANTVYQAIVYNPRVAAGTEASTLDAAVQAMLDALPIGGRVVSGSVAGRLLRDDIAECLLCNGSLGVRTVGLVTPSADVVLGATDIVQGVYTTTPEVS